MILKILFFPVKVLLYFIILMSLSQMVEIQGKSINTHFTQVFNSVKKWAYQQNILEQDSLTLKLSSKKQIFKEEIPEKDKNELYKIIKKNY